MIPTISILDRAKALSVLLAVVACASPTRSAAQSQDPCLRDQVLKCWHMVGAEGTAPDRVLRMVRSLDPPGSTGNPRKLELVEAIENPASDRRYIVRQVQVDCDRLAFREEAMLFGFSDGTAKAQPVIDSEWRPVMEGEQGQPVAAMIACPAPPGVSTKEHRSLLSSSIVTDAFRAADAVDWVRKLLWDGLVHREMTSRQR